MDKWELLQKYFGHDCFRGQQADVIDAIVAGRDTLCVMPTGAGKSICFQIAALLLPGLSIVVSPLISLMKDQVDVLVENGIPSAYINSSLDKSRYVQTMNGIRKGAYKLLYLAPERMEQEGFIQLISEAKISLLVVDEAHCISQWGHEFRPSYRNIDAFLKYIDRPIISAFTATATPLVQEDIERQLKMDRPFTVVTSFDRPNIRFEVARPEDKNEYLLHLLNPKESSIVYCATRKLVDQVHGFLESKGMSVVKYHAGMPQEEREQSQQEFLYDEKKIVVATVAFGMGIDKSNVRQVVHYNLPKSMENYYQEAGRCGRDAEPSVATLLYHPQDILIQKYLIELSGASRQEYERPEAMIQYAGSTKCLRKSILSYFHEERKENCGNCSVCRTPSHEVDMTTEAQKILSCIKRTEERWGARLVIDVLRGSRSKKVLQMHYDALSTYGIMANYEKKKIQRILEGLLEAEVITSSGGQYPILKLTQKAYAIFKGEPFFMTMPVETQGADKSGDKMRDKSGDKMRDKSGDKMRDKMEDEMQKNEREELFAALREWRLALSRAKKIPPFIILSDASLRDLCQKLPQNEEQLKRVSGFGEVKIGRYGEAVLGIIKRYKTTDLARGEQGGCV